jgi:hypothetical protein
MSARIGLVLLVLLTLVGSVEAHKPTTTKFTYHRDVYPIFREKCGSCHQGGGVAPMSLLAYKDAYPWAVSIKNEVLELTMPPWFADERYGSFRHPSALTAGEMNIIVDWCLGGSPEGDPADAPPAAPDVSESLGEPDLLLPLPEPFVLAADRAEATHDVEFAIPRGGSRALRALEFRPESRNIVRSVLVYVVPDGAALDAGEIVASWLPGQGSDVFPVGRRFPIAEGASIGLRIHYKKTWLDEGSEVTDRSVLALYFAGRGDGGDQGDLRTVRIDAGGGARAREDGRGFTKSVVETIEGPVEVLSLLARVEAHLDSLVAAAILPDGTEKALIRLDRPDPDWPRTYTLREPLALPEHSRIRLTLSAMDEEALAAAHAFLLDVVPN